VYSSAVQYSSTADSRQQVKGHRKEKGEKARKPKAKGSRNREESNLKSEDRIPLQKNQNLKNLAGLPRVLGPWTLDRSLFLSFKFNWFIDQT
jgi:hypothetical protein